MPQFEGVRTYQLKDLVHRHPELEELGIETYFLEGWELFFFILQNYEQLIDPETDFGAWFAACHVGQSRSKDFNEFLEQLNIPTGKKVHSIKEEPSAGIKYFDLSVLAAGGVVKNGVITPEMFERGFRNWVVFVSENELKPDRVKKLLSDSLVGLAGIYPPEEFKGMRIFMVNDSETDVAYLRHVIINALAGMNDPSDLAEYAAEFQSEFNTLYELRQGDLRISSGS